MIRSSSSENSILGFILCPPFLGNYRIAVTPLHDAAAAAAAAAAAPTLSPGGLLLLIPLLCFPWEVLGGSGQFINKFYLVLIISSPAASSHLGGLPFGYRYSYKWL